MIPKRASKAEINRFVEGQIRKSDKAPKNWNRMRQVAKDTATDLKVKGKKLKIPWGLLLIIIPGLIGIYLAITSFKRPEDEGGITPGKDLDEPVNIRGKSEEQLKGLFGYKGQGQKEPGRPFDGD